MHRTLEKLDGMGSSLVPLLYLLGLSLGTLAYFTGVTADFNLAVGSALAVAAELHSFLQLRRTRASYGLYARLAEDDPRRDLVRRQLRINLAILSGLVAFSAYNSVSFAAATWHPTGIGFLPAPWQIAIRGTIVPGLFLLAGFLSPLTADAGALLADASHTMLHKTLRTTLRQWKRRVDKAARGGLDLAPVAIALMRDAGDEDGARRVALIADGLAAAEGHAPSVDAGPLALLPAMAPALSLADLIGTASEGDQDPHPTGPGSPSAAPAGDHFRPTEREASANIGRPVSLPARRGKRTASARKASRIVARRASAFALLDDQPSMTKAGLRDELRCRQTEADGYYAEWQALRRRERRQVRAR